MSEQAIRTVADVEALAARMGIALSPDDYAEAQALADQRRQQIIREDELVSHTRSRALAWVDQFNRWYPKFLQALHATGDVLITLTHTGIIAFGIPLVLLALLIVEQARVVSGLMLFDTAHSIAALGAWVLVISNLSLELLISWREHQASWQEPAPYEFSFRLVSMRLHYLLGQQVDWKPARKSPAMRFKGVLRGITGTILALAVVGSMLTALTKANGDWYAAIMYILQHGTLLEMVTWLGGLLYAYTIVATAQALSHYVAERVMEIIAVMQSSGDDRDVRALEAAGATAAAAMLARLKDKQRTRRMQAAVVSAADMPDGMSEFSVPIPLASVNSASNGTERNERKARTENNGRRQRTPGAYQAAMAAYERGLTKQDVIEQGIAKKTAAYEAWAAFVKRSSDQ